MSANAQAMNRHQRLDAAVKKRETFARAVFDEIAGFMQAVRVLAHFLLKATA